MKRIIIIAAMMLAFTVSASAEKNYADDWKERMMSEKIAFLTVRMGITPEEAQAFWPVYNEISKQQDEAMFGVFKTFKDLEDAVKAGKSDKEVSKLLDKYLEAQELQREVEDKAVAKYKKVLPLKKLAKLYIGEEEFRRQSIRKLRYPSPNHMR